jgi:tetratricopeptide (TPR) repeat protein
MHKQASIAVSALISILTVASPAVATDAGSSEAGSSDAVSTGPHGSIRYSRTPNSTARRSLAQVPPMPVSAPPRTVSVPAAPRAGGLRPGYIRLAPGKNESVPRPPVNHMQRALVLRQQGNLDGALIEYLKAAQDNPSQVRAFYEQALIFKQKGYNKLAQSALQQALTVKPDFHDARVLLASLYLQDGDLSHATKELFSSLGLNLDKAIGSQKMPGPTPLRQASIVQTPHGNMSDPTSNAATGGSQPGADAAPSVVPQALKDIVGVHAGASQAAGTDAFNESHARQGSLDGESRQSSANNAGGSIHQDHAGSFSVKEISNEQTSDEEFLKKILGFSPPVNSIAAPGATPAPPTPDGQQTSVVGVDDHPVPKGAGEAKVVQASNDQATQLLKQLKGAPQKTDSFSWFNPFSWFDKSKTASAGENKRPPSDDIAGVNKAQRQAEQELAAQKKAEEKARKKAKEHADFNPVQTLEVAPTEEVHKQDHPGLLKKAFGWIPGFKDGDPHESSQYSLPPAPAIGSADSSAPAVVPGPGPQAPPPGAFVPPPAAPSAMVAAGENPPTPSNNTDALQSVLKMLPKDIARNLEQVLLPGKEQPAPLSGDQNPVAGINKNVFENLVSARVSSSSMPEAAPPAVSTPNAVLTPYIGSIPNTVSTPYTVATPKGASSGQAPSADNTTNAGANQPTGGTNAGGDPNVVETTLEAQVARAGIYIPPQLRVVPPRAGRLAAQGFRFVAPELISPRQYVISGAHPPVRATKKGQAGREDEQPVDAWTRRMRYLLANGTGSLSPGEAFMFSEETGDGVFFMPDGSSVRRKIAKGLGHDAVVQLRRPDIYNDKGELQYNLAVMGKVIVPKKDNETVEKVPGHFNNDASVKEVLNRSQGFFGWLTNMLTF